MDRHAKKLEKKRKSREHARKKADALAARRPSALTLLVRSAAREEFGPCFVSVTWDDLDSPALVSVLVTRTLPSGHLVPCSVLVDRTCLGIKDAFVMEPMLARDLSGIVDRMGMAHGGMHRCEPAVAQSIVFHAIDYARTLGFEPHRDFQAALFGPRPSGLLNTPWSSPDRPIYISGPRDDAAAITRKLTKAVGAAGFHRVDPLSSVYDDGDEYQDGMDEDPDAGNASMERVHSPLERVVARDGSTLHIFIYRGRDDVNWHLEVEDHLGGSTAWNEQFETDHAALEAALSATDQDGIESFLVPSEATTLSTTGLVGARLEDGGFCGDPHSPSTPPAR